MSAGALQTTYTVPELAELLQWSAPRVRRWLAFRNVPRTPVSRCKVVVTLPDLLAADEKIFEAVVKRLQLVEALDQTG